MSMCEECKNVRDCNYMFPKPPPPCATKVESKITDSQQLKAEIAAAVDAFQGDGIWMKDSDIINAFCAKLRQLSAI